jgi:hypothetical protein
MSVIFMDEQSNWATNNLTVDGNSENIIGSATPMVLDVDDAWAEFIFTATTRGWDVRS